ncbi:hypothetical protein [Clostridium sporogenes]|uniref:hypothetical protein n=1 Tax=Clostridium sporogenes TaxID=1509 RepID=UPI0013D32EA6|nr:hypothetical protein [Clostridium sporogenes]NFH40727.1 hypothetical protein [Clostridium sporogenes]
MRSNIKYIVNRLSFDVTTGKYNSTIVGRDAQIEVVADTKEETEYLHNDLIERLNKIGFESGECWSIEEDEKGKYSIVDYITVDNKEEYEEVKEIYIQWKKVAKTLYVNREVKEETNKSQNNTKNKNTNLSKDDETNLLLQIDQYDIVGKFINLSLDEIIEKYRDEFIQSEYNDYYEFLSDTLENIFYNLNMKI